MDAREGEVDPLSGQRAALPVLSGDESSAARYLLGVRAEAAQLAVERALSRKRVRGDVEGEARSEARNELHNAANNGLYSEAHDGKLDGVHVGRHDKSPAEHFDGAPSGVSVEPHSQTQDREYGSSLSGSARRPRPVPTQALPLNYDSQLNTAEVVRVTAVLFGGVAALDTQTMRSGLTAVYRAAKPVLRLLPAVHPAECTSLATWKEYTTAHDPVPLSHVDTFRIYKYLPRWLASRFQESHAVWAWSLLLRTPDVLSGDEVALIRDVTRALAPARDSQAARAFVYVVGTEYGQRDMLLLE